MTLGQIENKIERILTIRDTMTNKAERQIMDEKILHLLRMATSIRREQAERDLDRGMAEHAAWYDTSAE